MRLGADNKKELIAAIVLALIAAFAVMYWVNTSQTSASTAAPPAVTRTAPPPRATHAAPKATINPDTIDPSLRLDVLRASERITYSGKGRDIFRETVDIPRPVATPLAKKEPPPPVCPGPDPRCGPPPPPPINLKFYGFASKPGEPKKIFLQQGSDIFIAGEGDVVDRRYKVVHIGVNSVEIQDLLNNNTQTIPMNQG